MIRRFISYYKPHMRLFSMDMLCAVTVSVCGLIYPAVARQIINDYAPAGNLRALIIAAAILLGLYILKAVCTWFVGYYGHVVGVRMQADMRRDLFVKYEKLPVSFFDKNKTGDLLSRLVGDLFDVSELAHHGPENIFLSFLMLSGSLIILSGIHMTLTLIMLAVVPLILVFTMLSRRSMRQAMQKSRKQIAAINADLENSVSGIRETKVYVAEQYEIDKFHQGNGRFAAYRSEAMKSLGSFEAVMQFFSDLLYLIVIFIGGLFLYKGTLALGDFTAFILYISMFLDPIKRFAALFEQLQDGMSGFERFCEVMEQPEEVDAGTVEITDVLGDIRFEDVSFRYDTEVSSEDAQEVLHHIDLHIRAGETVALVGPSGGGKSTICHLIPRLYEVQQGRILLDGIDVRDITTTSLRRSIGIVSQNIFLFDGTIRENIAYGVENADDEAVFEAARKANIHTYIQSLENGYDTHVGERGIRLSGGQRQRVAIARMFLKDPKLLILDEATSALDNVTEWQIQQSLEELAHGRTTVIVAHRLSTVRHADKIMVIDGGRIVEEGTHSSLIDANGVYAELCRGAAVIA